MCTSYFPQMKMDRPAPNTPITQNTKYSVPKVLHLRT